MAVINILSPHVADLIAAGEVVERPASVIKELMENAFDAGAKNVTVELRGGGVPYIRVTDDGCGMAPEDAGIAFLRHATSKLHDESGLEAIRTMGFRGEALASVAAVAQVELKTRRAEDELGTVFSLSGSKVMGQQPVACPVGSNFLVENLFFNVPARRKFLKSNATELNNILTAFERIVLVYPNICFTLHSNGQELMNLRAGSLRQRITDVYGRRYGQDLLPVSVDTALCKISGFVAKPETARKKGAHEYFFVNGRFMKHAYFHKAVQQAYERLVLSGARVPYFIYFDVSPADIDVNIHPTKTEIKFENEQAIWQILSAAVKDAIGQFCEIPQIEFDTEGRPDIPVYNPVATPVEMPHVERNPQYNPFKEKAPRNWERLYEDLPTQPSHHEQSLFEESAKNDMLLPNETPISEQPVELTDVSPLHYQYKGRYIMTAVKSGLMIIDQHRADIRIRYERYMQQLTDAPSSSQRMLFPEVIEMAPSEAVLMEDMMPALTAVGFELTPLGPSSYAVSGVPAGIEGLNATQLLQDIIASSVPISHESLSINHQVALSLARHAAIPYGQQLTNEEMDVVVNNLFACDNVNYTPDGKAVLCILPQADIEHLLA